MSVVQCQLFWRPEDYLNHTTKPQVSRTRPRFQTICGKIESILGTKPTRSELINFTNYFEWAQVGRNERRVKASLISKLEAQRDRILPFLESHEGSQAIKDLYVRMLSMKRVQSIMAGRSGEAPSDRPGQTFFSYH
jgi:hypothetical protein